MTLTPYNQKWLPKDSEGRDIPDHLRVSFNPATAWVEDRWLLCRRMSGDTICQILFYHLCTFIWQHNDLDPREVQERQDALLNSVFQVNNIREFKNSLNDTVQIMTWDGNLLVWMSKEQIHNMFLETCTLGPLAAMFGREFQQYLLVNKGTNKIPKVELEYSVNSGRTSMSDKRISTVQHEYLEDGRDDDRASQASKRTRSPRKGTFHKAPWKQSPTNRCDVDMRDQYDDRRSRDIRERPDHGRLREDLRGPRGGDVRDQDFYPREGDRRNYTQSEPEPRQPRHYERRSKERDPRPYDREYKDRTCRRD